MACSTENEPGLCRGGNCWSLRGAAPRPPGPGRVQRHARQTTRPHRAVLKTIEFGATPVSVSFPPCRLAPRAFNTINDGTMSGPAWPIVFSNGTCSGVGAVWANAGAPPQSRRAMIMQPVRFFMVMSNSLLSSPSAWARPVVFRTELHRKRIHRFTCRVRAPLPGRPLGRVTRASRATGSPVGLGTLELLQDLARGCSLPDLASAGTPCRSQAPRATAPDQWAADSSRICRP